MNDEEFGAAQALLQAMPLADEDRAFLAASLWTQGEVPEAQNQAQADAYEALSNDLASGLPDRSSPEYPAAFVEWARSRRGILSASYGARAIEWAERRDP